MKTIGKNLEKMKLFALLLEAKIFTTTLEIGQVFSQKIEYIFLNLKLSFEILRSNMKPFEKKEECYNNFSNSSPSKT